LKVNVIKQETTFRLKNNTARVMYLKLYVCSPKSILPPAGIDPAIHWIDEMTNERGNASITEQDKRNLASASPNTLYATPYLCKNWMNRFATDCTNIILEPGKEYVHKVVGPNMEYKFNKYYEATNAGAGGGSFQNQQKFVKFAFLTCYYDLVGTSGGACSRGVNMFAASDSVPYGLLVETTNYTKISQPDQTGIKNPAAFVSGANQPLNQRKDDPYWLADYSNLGPVGPVGVVEDENPQAPATIAI